MYTEIIIDKLINTDSKELVAIIRRANIVDMQKNLMGEEYDYTPYENFLGPIPCSFEDFDSFFPDPIDYETKK